MAADAADHELAPGFREAMSMLATGVVLVTTHVDGRPWGTTVSACCSVSMQPPLLLVSLARESTSAKAITADGRFGVCILGGHLLEVARFGSAPGQPKFIESFCDTGECEEEPPRSPAIAGAPAHVDCRVERRIEAGDHILFLGKVEAVAVSRNIGPLVYFARGFHTLPGTPPETVDLEGALTALLANGYQW
jgi:flavin reductase (DIM6/NTAB) family NADH-FMN oxidoreductase RutF